MLYINELLEGPTMLIKISYILLIFRKNSTLIPVSMFVLALDKIHSCYSNFCVLFLVT